MTQIEGLDPRALEQSQGRTQNKQSFEEYSKEKFESEWKRNVDKKKKGMDNDQRIAKATEYKNIGGDKFKSGNTEEAIEYYREALEYVKDLVDARKFERSKLVVPLRLNLARCFEKQQDYKTMLEHAEEAVKIAEVPRYEVKVSFRAKAFLRRGFAKIHLSEYEEARDDFKKVLKLPEVPDEFVTEADAQIKVLNDKITVCKKVAVVKGGFFNNRKKKDSTTGAAKALCDSKNSSEGVEEKGTSSSSSSSSKNTTSNKSDFKDVNNFVDDVIPEDIKQSEAFQNLSTEDRSFMENLILEQLQKQKEEAGKTGNSADSFDADEAVSEAQKQFSANIFKKMQKKDDMLYADVEKKMEPVREKIKNENKALELERDLLNIIDDGKGKKNLASGNFDEFLENKERRWKEQEKQLEAKKKVLDKLDKEKEWEEDDEWMDRQKNRRAAKKNDFYKNFGSSETGGATESTFPESKHKSVECTRWVRSKLREVTVGVALEATESLDPKLVQQVVGAKPINEEKDLYCLKALIADIHIVDGDSGIFQTKTYMKPFHYFDYHLKFDWEICMAKRGETTYRDGKAIIKDVCQKMRGRVPDKNIDKETGRGHGDAPDSLSGENNVSYGCFEILEFCNNEQGGYDGAEEVKLHTEKKPEYGGGKVERMCGELLEKFEGILMKRLAMFVEEFMKRED